MYPILFRIGNFKVYSSVVFFVLGLLAGLVAGWVEARRRGIPARSFYLYWGSAIPISLILAVLNGLFFEVVLWNLLQNFEFELFGGLVSFGAVLGALGWGYVLAKITRQPAGPGLDAISVVFPLILGVYRIGCLLNGCCYGRETDGILGMVLPGGGGVWAPRYPTQIMLMLFNFALFAWLWLRRKRTAFQGELTLGFLLLYSGGRFFIDAFRDLPGVLGPLSLHQLEALAIFLVTSVFGLKMRKARRAAS
jgi:phosphatidylglycerol:prolipoprotein diacylglycerol transferase